MAPRHRKDQTSRSRSRSHRHRNKKHRKRKRESSYSSYSRTPKRESKPPPSAYGVLPVAGNAQAIQSSGTLASGDPCLSAQGYPYQNTAPGAPPSGDVHVPQSGYPHGCSGYGQSQQRDPRDPYAQSSGYSQWTSSSAPPQSGEAHGMPPGYAQNMSGYGKGQHGDPYRQMSGYMPDAANYGPPTATSAHGQMPGYPQGMSGYAAPPLGNAQGPSPAYTQSAYGMSPAVDPRASSAMYAPGPGGYGMQHGGQGYPHGPSAYGPLPGSPMGMPPGYPVGPTGYGPLPGYPHAMAGYDPSLGYMQPMGIPTSQGMPQAQTSSGQAPGRCPSPVRKRRNQGQSKGNERRNGRGANNNNNEPASTAQDTKKSSAGSSNGGQNNSSKGAVPGKSDLTVGGEGSSGPELRNAETESTARSGQGSGDSISGGGVDAEGSGGPKDATSDSMEKNSSSKAGESTDQSKDQTQAASAQPLSRPELIRTVFRLCDADCDGFLNEKEMCKLAVQRGFQGGESKWGEEYRLICSKNDKDPATGIDIELLEKVLSDNSDDNSHYTTDESLQTIRSVLEINNFFEPEKAKAGGPKAGMMGGSKLNLMAANAAKALLANAQLGPKAASLAKFQTQLLARQILLGPQQLGGALSLAGPPKAGGSGGIPRVVPPRVVTPRVVAPRTIAPQAEGPPTQPSVPVHGQTFKAGGAPPPVQEMTVLPPVVQFSKSGVASPPAALASGEFSKSDGLNLSNFGALPTGASETE